MLVKGNSRISGNIRSILLIQLGDIGDVVLSFPAVRALRENFSHADVIVAVRGKALDILENCPWASGAISINTGQRSLIQKIGYQKNFFLQLWKYQFDLAIDLRADPRGAVLAFLSGARQRVGFFQKGHPFWRNWLFTHLAVPYGKPDDHMTEYYSNLLAEYHITPSDIWPVIVVSEQKQEMAGKLFNEENVPQDRPIIAIQPFCLWQYKEWGAEKYIQLIQQIRTAYNFPVIITGSPEERVRADRITESCGNHVYNLAGKTPMGLLPAVLKACRLFIGSDSAGMHIAAGVGTPTVTIYGPSSVSDWAPRGSKHSIVHTELPCLPCHQKGCDGSGTSRCLEGLTVDEAMPAVKCQLDRILND